MKSGTSSAWSPDGFLDYQRLYPATPAFPLPEMDTSRRFAELWRALGGAGGEALRRRLATGYRDESFVILRGYLGNYMPGNLVAARDALRALGIDAFIARNGAGATIAENAARVAAEVKRRVPRGRRLVFLGHSKGGIEALRILADDPDLAGRTRAVVLSQTPRGASAVLESLLLRRHQASLRGPGRVWAERIQRLGLRLIGADRSGHELTSEALAAVLAPLDVAGRPFRLLQTASWSSRPTTWLDSFHQRLGEIRPGCAHDGQFYLEDLVWPGVPHVLLPRVDHAQPVMSGHGFDSARYWLAVAALELDGA
jgi:hypothetical protein